VISDYKVTEIFCEIDNFMLEYDNVIKKAGIETTKSIKLRKRKFKMSDSEVMTIMVIFHLKSYRNLKHY
jgi:hypothetical protein